MSDHSWPYRAVDVLCLAPSMRGIDDSRMHSLAVDGEFTPVPGCHEREIVAEVGRNVEVLQVRARPLAQTSHNYSFDVSLNARRERR